MKALKSSIIWQLVLPIPVLLSIGLVAAWFLIPRGIDATARQVAIRSAPQIADQYKTIRGYYTQNVVKKAITTGGLKSSVDHAKMANGIPLPATFIHDIGALLSKKDTTLSL